MAPGPAAGRHRVGRGRRPDRPDGARGTHRRAGNCAPPWWNASSPAPARSPASGGGAAGTSPTRAWAGSSPPSSTALADPDAPQPDPDQSYLALMLARQASPADVITPVLEAAARPDLDHGLRAVAARTAATLDEAAAVPVLAGVLAEISRAPRARSRRRDPGYCPVGPVAPAPGG